MPSIRNTIVCSALAIASVAVLAAGCQSGSDESPRTRDTAGEEDTSSATDGADRGPRDVGSSDDTASTHDARSDTPRADFLVSGRYTGTATLQFEDADGPQERDVHVMLTEIRGKLEGVATILDSESGDPQFEYALDGAIDADRTELELDFSARRCAFGDEGECSEALDPDKTPDEPVLEGTGTFSGDDFRFDQIDVKPEFTGPSKPAGLSPVLKSMRVEPAFDIDDRYASPGGGFKPVHVDTGIDATSDAGDGVDPLPEGRTTWQGDLSNRSVVGGPDAASVACEWAIARNGRTLRIETLRCGERELRVDGESRSEPPRIIPESVEFIPEIHEIRFLVRAGTSYHLFIGDRVGDYFTGVVVRDPELRERGDASGAPRPAHPRDYPISKVEAAFHWTRK